jgi:hypothetical protein
VVGRALAPALGEGLVLKDIPIPCCCGHEHDENKACPIDGCHCMSWHWYSHEHWNPTVRIAENKMLDTVVDTHIDRRFAPRD